MSRYKPEVFDKMVLNTELDKGCMIWKGEFDNYGHPVMQAKRHKNVLIRQDVIMFEHIYPEYEGLDENYLIHVCGRSTCINPEHMKYITDLDERVEHDRGVTQKARWLLSQGRSIDEVMSETGLSRIRLTILSNGATMRIAK